MKAFDWLDCVIDGRAYIIRPSHYDYYSLNISIYHRHPTLTADIFIPTDHQIHTHWSPEYGYCHAPSRVTSAPIRQARLPAHWISPTHTPPSIWSCIAPLLMEPALFGLSRKDWIPFIRGYHRSTSWTADRHIKSYLGGFLYRLHNIDIDCTMLHPKQYFDSWTSGFVLLHLRMLRLIELYLF